MTPIRAPSDDRLPVLGLLGLAAAGFLTILTEALPAGLLFQMSADLAVSEAMVGQLITAYALGSLIAAIPLTAATRGWRRRPLLMTAVGGFLLVNIITAVSTSYVLTLCARFFAGAFAGLVWALLAGYASRMAPEHLKGRAIALAMIGTPLALTIGIPAGTLIGGIIGWRPVFIMMSGLSILLVAWIAWCVPDFEGETGGDRASLASVLGRPGLKPVLAATLGFVLAHNILYTYIAPLLDRAGMGGRVDATLLLFGVAAIGSIWMVAVGIDRRLRTLTLASVGLFLVAALMLGAFGQVSWIVLLAVVIWGLGFGGAASLFQTASARIAGEAADVAQSMVVTAWNLAIAGGGLLGGLMLLGGGAGLLPWSCVLLLAAIGLVVWKSRLGFA
ncbi:MFS transporter [Brevundimonas sp. EAKA]|jgi:predicted MFS family arabinose efflux permease|uniref:Purine ribonucleoside efflux pump NepI n=1 Tax=Brevundimonas mediterranea TaxID=74329 RepID=A0A7Z9C3T2_9CAUL|nr:MULTISPECIES: MFS transporter [Brevundimonas]KDP95829.1 MFS transporter [Brevundimonas sp. EAKA]VDC48586.1 Purine ribonucleoside efflux pump NepI [Brevundimonas mediterranea]